MDEKFDAHEIDRIIAEINTKKRSRKPDYTKEISLDTEQLEKAKSTQGGEHFLTAESSTDKADEVKDNPTTKSEPFRIDVDFLSNDEDDDEEDFSAIFSNIKKQREKIYSEKSDNKFSEEHAEKTIKQTPQKPKPAVKVTKEEEPSPYVPIQNSKNSRKTNSGEFVEPFKVSFDEDPDVVFEEEHADELYDLRTNGGISKKDEPAEGFELVKGKFGVIDAKKDKVIRDFFDWIETILVPIVGIIVVLAFLVRTNVVIGMSMQPSLFDGQRLLVYQFLYQPSFGDVVIIQADNLPNQLEGGMGEGIVKRVIGLPGDQIYIDPQTGTVFRNGEALDEEYIAEPIDIYHLGTQTYPLTVPENSVFVLGDNRNNSTDSRWANIEGAEYYVDCVDFKYVIGKAFFRVWPLDKIGAIK